MALLRLARNIHHAAVGPRYPNESIIQLRRVVFVDFADHIAFAARGDIDQKTLADLLRLPAERFIERLVQVMTESEVSCCAKKDKQQREQTRIPDCQPELDRARVHAASSSL